MSEIPAEAVEAAARAMCETWYGAWDLSTDFMRLSYGERARRVLTAAVPHIEAAYRGANPVTTADPHVYLSTACLHGKHGYCGSARARGGGRKIPRACKWCEALCVCRCHVEPEEADRGEEKR